MSWCWKFKEIDELNEEELRIGLSDCAEQRVRMLEKIEELEMKLGLME